ncbi:MAG: hypothetical protein Q7V57_16095 [Actinomycetota bacterium]|nr:hypothetical protein [Actinomycetota bacterium]
MTKAAVLAAALLLAACSSDTSRGAISPGESTTPSQDDTTTVAETLPPTDTTLAGVFVQPPASEPTLYYVDNAGTADAPLVIVASMTADGTITELWSESTETYLNVLDVAPGGQRLLLRRLHVDPATNEGVFVLSIRELASGAETVVGEGTTYTGGEFARDGSGDLLVSYQLDTSSNHLDRLGADGHLIAGLAANDDVFGIDWLQLANGDLVVGGQPMTIISAMGEAKGSAGNTDRSCRPVRRAAPAVVLAACGESEVWITQLWLVPLDGSAPLQATKVEIEPSGVDFGVGDLWTTTDGRQWVQRYGDCGAAWVEELQADGTAVDADAHGVILGVAGTRLITASNGMCEGGSTTIEAYDSATGANTVLLEPSADDTGEIVGVNTFDIVVVPR